MKNNVAIIGSNKLVFENIAFFVSDSKMYNIVFEKNYFPQNIDSANLYNEIKNNNPDLVILTNTSGFYDFIGNYKISVLKDTSLLVLTTNDETEMYKKVHEATPFVLYKPFTQEKLIETIDDILK